MKLRILLITVCVVLLLGGCSSQKQVEPNIADNNAAVWNAPAQNPSASDEQIKQLFDAHASDVQITGTGTVARMFSDDNDGDKHQRFIVELGSGQTLLIVHNIDIAPRVDPLQVGDTVEFSGEYVYNNEGGLVHWTHHDPNGSHAPGFIIANGKTFS